MDLSFEVEEAELKCKMLLSNMRAMGLAIFQPGPLPVKDYEAGYDLLIDYVIELDKDLKSIINQLYRKEAV